MSNSPPPNKAVGLVRAVVGIVFLIIIGLVVMRMGSHPSLIWVIAVAAIGIGLVVIVGIILGGYSKNRPPS